MEQDTVLSKRLGGKISFQICFALNFFSDSDLKTICLQIICTLQKQDLAFYDE